MPRPLLLVLLLILSGCTGRSEEVLPVSEAIRGASRVEEVELRLQPPVRAAVAALDERARTRSEGDAALPLSELLPRRIAEAARARGLVSGRPLRLIVELDELQVAGTGSALLGKADRMAGTVFIRDLASGAPLGQLYIDIDKRTSSLVALALRGGGIRERLAETFAEQVAASLAPQKPSR